MLALVALIVVGPLFAVSGNRVQAAETSNGPQLELAISEEFTGGSVAMPNTGDGGGGTNGNSVNVTEAISSESQFVAEVGEGSFTTGARPSSSGASIVSSESAFQTASGGARGDVAIGDEVSFTTVFGEGQFTTLAPPGGGGGGGGGSGGGGSSGEGGSSGGGGGGGSLRRVPPLATAGASVCPPYLWKFIKRGANNDPVQVRRLQTFLRDEQGFKGLAVTGFYDEVTFAAVSVFQRRYFRDVLAPWGLKDATGWVYITTTLTINNLHCQRDTRHNLNFRSQVKSATSLVPIATSTPIALLASSTIINASPQPIVSGWEEGSWWLIGVLLVAFGAMIGYISQLRKRVKELEALPSLDGGDDGLDQFNTDGINENDQIDET